MDGQTESGSSSRPAAIQEDSSTGDISNKLCAEQSDLVMDKCLTEVATESVIEKTDEETDVINLSEEIMDKKVKKELLEADTLIATELHDDLGDMLDMPGDWSVVDQVTETGAEWDPVDQEAEKADVFDSAVMAEEFEGDLGTDNEETGDDVSNVSVTKVDSPDKEAESNGKTDDVAVSWTKGNSERPEDEKGQIAVTRNPKERTTVEVEIDLIDDSDDVQVTAVSGEADNHKESSSPNTDVLTEARAGTNNFGNSNVFEQVSQTKACIDNTPACQKELKQIEEQPADDSEDVTDRKKNLLDKQRPHFLKTESSDKVSFTFRSVESTDDECVEVSGITDGDFMVVEDDSDVIEIPDSPAKETVKDPAIMSAKGDKEKACDEVKDSAASGSLVAQKPVIIFDRGFEIPVPKSLSKLKQLTVNIGPIRLIDLHCKQLYNILKINRTFEIKFEPKEKTLDNGTTVVDYCGYVRLPFQISFPPVLVKIASKLSDLNINGRDMSVKFPEAFNRAVEECNAWVQKRNQYSQSCPFEARQRRLMIQQWPKDETSEEKLKELFPNVDKIIMQIGKDYDNQDICLAVYLEFASVADLERFLNTGASNIALNGRLITFSRIIKRGAKPYPVHAPGQEGNKISTNKTPGNKNSPRSSYNPPFGAPAVGNKWQRGRGRGFRGRGGRGGNGRPGAVGSSPRTTPHSGHHAPRNARSEHTRSSREYSSGQFGDLRSLHGQFEADFRPSEHDRGDKFGRPHWSHNDTQRDAWRNEARRHDGTDTNRWRSPKRFEQDQHRRSVVQPDETMAMLEAMKSKLETMERKLADKDRSMQPPVAARKEQPPVGARKDPFRDKGQTQRGMSAGRKGGRGRGKNAGTSRQFHHQTHKPDYQSPRQHSPGQRFGQGQNDLRLSAHNQSQTAQWSGQRQMQGRKGGQPVMGKSSATPSYDRGQFAASVSPGEQRTGAGQGHLGLGGGSGAGGTGGGYRGRGKSRNKQALKRKANNFDLDDQEMPKRQYMDGNSKDGHFQSDNFYGAGGSRWQQERYPDAKLDGSRVRDRGQSGEHTFPSRELPSPHTFPSRELPSPYELERFAGPQTSYFHQY